MSVATEVLPGILPRLERASSDAESKRDALNASLELRNQIIVEAIDNGISQRDVAKAASISRALVNKALAGSQQLVEFER